MSERSITFTATAEVLAAVAPDTLISFEVWVDIETWVETGRQFADIHSASLEGVEVVEIAGAINEGELASQVLDKAEWEVE